MRRLRGNGHIPPKGHLYCAACCPWCGPQAPVLDVPAPSKVLPIRSGREATADDAELQLPEHIYVLPQEYQPVIEVARSEIDDPKRDAAVDEALKRVRWRPKKEAA